MIHTAQAHVLHLFDKTFYHVYEGMISQSESGVNSLDKTFYLNDVVKLNRLHHENEKALAILA